MLLALLLAEGPYSPVQAAATREVRVEGAIINVRGEPAASAATLFQMRAGESALLVSSEGAWLQIEVDGRRGWVYRTLVERSRSSTTRSAASWPTAIPSSPPAS